MPAPKFTEPDQIQLRVENISLYLIDNGRGALVIEGAAGTIANEQAIAASQIHKILHTNLGFLIASEAAVYLRPLPTRGFALVAHASYAYEELSPAVLTRKIEDVIRAVEYYSAELKSGSTVPRQRRSEPDEPDSAVIFRP